MTLEILCAPTFPDDEYKELHETAAALGITPEALIRRAVKSFNSQCVPTQRAAAGSSSPSIAPCVPTH